VGRDTSGQREIKRRRGRDGGAKSVLYESFNILIKTRQYKEITKEK